jgi:hypothetical protein
VRSRAPATVESSFKLPSLAIAALAASVAPCAPVRAQHAIWSAIVAEREGDIAVVFSKSS